MLALICKVNLNFASISHILWALKLPCCMTRKQLMKKHHFIGMQIGPVIGKELWCITLECLSEMPCDLLYYRYWALLCVCVYIYLFIFMVQRIGMSPHCWGSSNVCMCFNDCSFSWLFCRLDTAATYRTHFS